MHSLDAACDGLLQFFEAAAEQQQQQQQQEGQRSQQEQAGEQGIDAQGLTAVVALGAARALGRYFAEAPGAVRSERVLKALPLVMGVGTEGAQVGAPQPPASGLEQEQGGSSVVEPRPLEEFALTFLLPGLIQVRLGATWLPGTPLHSIGTSTSSGTLLHGTSTFNLGVGHAIAFK